MFDVRQLGAGSRRRWKRSPTTGAAATVQGHGGQLCGAGNASELEQLSTSEQAHEICMLDAPAAAKDRHACGHSETRRNHKICVDTMSCHAIVCADVRNGAYPVCPREILRRIQTRRSPQPCFMCY